MIVLDTSALLFWTLDPSRLSPQAHAAIAGAGKIVVSSISLWEIALKVKRGKINLPITVEDYARRLGQVEGLEILPVDLRTWLDKINLVWEHRDPADRTIVALAARLDCPLIASDGVIASFYRKTLW